MHFSHRTLILCLIGIGFQISLVAQDDKGLFNRVTTRVYTTESCATYYEDVTYCDDLGRPYKEIARGASPMRKTLMRLQEYDLQGNIAKEWLPSPVESEHTTEIYKDLVSTYYNDTHPFTLHAYENSPLNRRRKTIGPGSAWHTGARANTWAFQLNTIEGNTSCVRFEIKSGGDIKNNGYYNPGELIVRQETDEDGNIVYHFTDKNGRLLLDRVCIGPDKYNDTYFIYDVYGWLRYVLPPMAAAELSARQGKIIGRKDPLVQDYAYRYCYNSRGMCVEKKLPGLEPWRYAYDKADRLIFTQTGNMRTAGGWLAYSYDVFGRLVHTTFVKSSLSISDLTGILEGKLVQDDFLPEDGSPMLVDAGYSNRLLPEQERIPREVIYYDDYSYLFESIFQQNPELERSIPSGLLHTRAKGLVTGKRIYDEAGKQYTLVILIYDDLGRERKRVVSLHIPQAVLETETKYNFLNAPVEIDTRLTVSPSEPGNTFTESFSHRYEYKYDHRGRPTEIIRDGVPIKLYTYDAVGRLSGVSQGQKKNQTNYRYNLRGWTECIYNPVIGYEERLRYLPQPSEGGFTSSTTGSYSGNIMEWTEKNGLGRWHSDLQYDALSRLVLKETTYRTVDINGVVIEGKPQQFGYLDGKICLRCSRQSAKKGSDSQ